MQGAGKPRYAVLPSSKPRILPARRFIEFIVLVWLVSILCFLNISREGWVRCTRILPQIVYDPPDLSAGNSTLGFGIILAVSSNKTEETAWRQDGLVAAANRTGLDITIPPQPVFANADLRQLTDGKEGDFGLPQVGHAQAWLGHVHVLKNFLASSLSTALLLEDDADWDVSIRSQTTLLAQALSQPITPSSPSTLSPPQLSLPPSPLAWDVLWLGHCGDSHLSAPFTRPYADPSTLPAPLLRGLYHENLPNGTRLLHPSAAPVCSFAYAVTRAGAAQLLALSPPFSAAKPDPHPAEATAPAWDLQLSGACAQGRVRCVTVNPELMHHHRMGGRGFSAIGEANGEERVSEHDYTWNVGWSARCNVGRWGDGMKRCLPGEEDP
ncbi:hypothetical protein MMC13_005360 [Lambiella insularis]|nr:hypothetical protein [Lambiella insularis]